MAKVIKPKAWHKLSAKKRQDELQARQREMQADSARRSAACTMMVFNVYAGKHEYRQIAAHDHLQRPLPCCETNETVQYLPGDIVPTVSVFA